MAGLNSTALVHHLKGHMNGSLLSLENLKPKVDISKTNSQTKIDTFTTVIHLDPKNVRLWYIVLVLGSLLVLGNRTLFVRLYIPTAFI